MKTNNLIEPPSASNDYGKQPASSNDYSRRGSAHGGNPGPELSNDRDLQRGGRPSEVDDYSRRGSTGPGLLLSGYEQEVAYLAYLAYLYYMVRTLYSDLVSP